MPELTQETQVSITTVNTGPGCYLFVTTQRLKESGVRVSEMTQSIKVLVARPEFDPWEPQGRRREQTSQSCPLTSTLRPKHVCTSPPVYKIHV